MIVAVTGMAREARLVAHRDVLPVVGGGDTDMLEKRIDAAVAGGGRRILSIGICGALCPELRVGDVVIASEIVTEEGTYPVTASWMRELAARLPEAMVAPMTAGDLVSAHREQKADLRASTKARTVDMESHVAARAALAHGLPFAALRVVSDGAHRTLPPAARIALHPSGGIDLPAVLRSIVRAPQQILPLMRTAWEAEIAFAKLLSCAGIVHNAFTRTARARISLEAA
jgi:hopanoid-associated phosphorylase